MSHIILFDNKSDYSFLSKEFDKVIYSPKCRIKLLSWYKGAWSAFKCSKSSDIIVCWYDFQAVLLFVITSLLFSKRNILCLNILLKNKNTLKNSIIRFLYKRALSSDSFKATVTSLHYGKLVNKWLKSNFDFYLLRDVYHDSYEYNSNANVRENSVFCGGHNGRDWSFLFKLSEMLPDLLFNVVVPQTIYDQFKSSVGPNVNLYTNVPYNRFMDILNSSTFVCLPLDTDAPAGLIVLFQAAANNKMVIITKTATTIEYVNDCTGVLLENDLTLWAKTIECYMKNNTKSMDFAIQLKKYLVSNCNEQCFVQTIKQILVSF